MTDSSLCAVYLPSFNCKICSCVATPSVQRTRFQVYTRCGVLGEDVYTNAILVSKWFCLFTSSFGGKRSREVINEEMIRMSLQRAEESASAHLSSSSDVLGGDSSLAAQSGKQEGQVTTDHILCQIAKDGDTHRFLSSLLVMWAGRSIISAFEAINK